MGRVIGITLIFSLLFSHRSLADDPLAPSAGIITFDCPVATVTPGSSFSLDIDLSLTPNAEPVQSLSFSAKEIANAGPANFTSDLPAGWDFSFNENVFTAENISGQDLTGNVTIGQLEFTVGVNDTVGDYLTFNPAENVTLLDDQGISAVTEVAYLGPVQGPLIVPEPSGVFYALASLVSIASALWRRKVV